MKWSVKSKQVVKPKLKPAVKDRSLNYRIRVKAWQTIEGRSNDMNAYLTWIERQTRVFCAELKRPRDQFHKLRHNQDRFNEWLIKKYIRKEPVVYG